MKKMYLFCFLYALVSCTEELVDEDESTFRVEVQGPETVEVDELVTLKFKGSRTIDMVARINDDGTSGYIDPATPIDEIYLRFAFVGVQQVSLLFTSTDNEEFSLDYSVNVVAGRAVKINRVVVNSFDRIDKTWDSEFAENDPNRLADVAFSIEKTRTYLSLNPTGETSRFYISQIKENQGNLDWDLSGENVYVNLNQTNGFNFGFGDDDGGNVGQDLLNGRKKTITRSDLELNKDPIYILEDPSINLRVTFYLEWPE